jgi:hypothetical protein
MNYNYYFIIIIIIVSIIIIHILTILINNISNDIFIFSFFRIVKNITLLPLFHSYSLICQTNLIENGKFGQTFQSIISMAFLT